MTHPVAEMYAAEHKAGKLDRREFLVRSTALGLTAAAAYALIGATPAVADGHRAVPAMGGTLRIQQEVRALKDPRTYDWSQIANVTRGFLEYLIQYNNDGSFEGVLLDRWDANEDATQYTLILRQGVVWNNGDAFTAHDVAANIIGWCDSTVAGNSMATRMGGLVDADTGLIRDGGVEVLDDYTVRVTYPAPDITFIPGIADYPSAIQHRDLIGTNPADHGVGTGAYEITNYEVGVSATLSRKADHAYWGSAYLDEIQFVDLGQDPAAWVAGAQADAFDMTYETVGAFIDQFDAIGWTKDEVRTAATVVIRPNQNHAPYDDVRVRNAIQLAVDNQVVLDLGSNGNGVTAENHHVCPIHPEYAVLPPQVPNPAAARALLEATGHQDTEFQIVCVDDDFRRNTAEAVAAQLTDAGFNVSVMVVPDTVFVDEWRSYPFSTTNWNHRELGVMMLNLAYRTGVPWNETGFSNEEFDTLLTEAIGIQDANTRRDVMARLQTIMQDEGVTLQPYWRSLYRHFREGIANAEMHAKFEINVHHLGFLAR